MAVFVVFLFDLSLQAGDTALHIAAGYVGRLDIVKFLVEVAKADIHARNPYVCRCVSVVALTRVCSLAERRFWWLRPEAMCRRSNTSWSAKQTSPPKTYAAPPHSSH